MSLKKLKQDWECLASADPMWAICNDPLNEGMRWNEKEFFLSGENEINIVIEYLRFLGLDIDFNGTALDFGCGIGRLTQALARRFSLCYGIDISSGMIKLANQYNAYKQKCIYLENFSDKLNMFGENSISFIYSSLVFQHIEPKHTKTYLKQLVNILKPGGIFVFQMPSCFMGPEESFLKKLRNTLQLRTRIKRCLSFAGPCHVLPAIKQPGIKMYCIPIKEISSIIESRNVKITDVVNTNSTNVNFNGRLIYLKEEELCGGYISKQYCVVKQ
ncbi:MAG: class I SAM-dependent methyltransferase [Candidatus Omnitrophica bacterium]|nr:class I SAM-dependent methyltransferase [Candidatus Omnitrophota bacterium]